MSKIILIALIIFCAYLFINISASAKDEVVKQVFDIPNDTVAAFQQFTNGEK